MPRIDSIEDQENSNVNLTVNVLRNFAYRMDQASKDYTEAEETYWFEFASGFALSLADALMDEIE